MSNERMSDGGEADESEAAYWAFVIARGLRALEEGRVASWDDATDERIRRRVFGDDEP